MSGDIQDKSSETISAMFNRIACSYDNVNHILSFNADRFWRRRMVKFILSQSNGREGFRVLDVACGTGDSTLALCRKGIYVVGMDIAGNMLEVARRKSRRVCIETQRAIPEYIIGSAEEPPFLSESFDAVSISFGIRNFENREKSLSALYGVIKKGGSIAILEFAKPLNPLLRAVYDIYLNRFLPLAGGILSKDRSAYEYLAASIEQFPKYGEFCRELENAGFKSVSYKSMTGGVALLYTGMKI